MLMRKMILIRLPFFLALLYLAACSSLHGSSNYHAVVDASGTNPNAFTTVQAAVNAAPADTGQRYRILVKAGHYYEKITINRSNIEIVGDGMGETVIDFDAYASEAGHYRKDNWGTPGSATVSINAEKVHIADLTINNTFDFLANDAKTKDDPSRVAASQAVAVLLDTGSDKVSFDSVELNGYQDTLFAHGYRAYFHQSRISGNVDFIFGQGAVVFNQSTIVSRPRAKSFPKGAIQSYITAPSTNIGRDYGLTFLDCKLLREEGVPDSSVTLGRPWHPTTTFADGRYADPDAIGKAVFIRTFMDAHISPEGWSSMGGTARDGTKSRIFTPDESRFYEYRNFGPGAAVNGERPQLSAAEAAKYTLENIFGDWQP
jgi:pectinesterase